MSELFGLLWLISCSGRGRGVEEELIPTTTSSAPEPSVEFVADPPKEGLDIVLYDASPSGGALPQLPVPATAPLDPAATSSLLSRLPELAPREGDRSVFSKRAGSKPPPLPGSDAMSAFPPDTSRDRPSVPTGPLSIVRHAPDGEVPLAPHFSVTFSQPMVAVTSQEEAAKTVPAKMTPEVPGRWRWLGTKTLLFDPDPRLPMATEFSVTIPAGTRSAAGLSLERAESFTFSTPPPALAESWPQGGPVGLEPILVASFDQQIDPEKVLPHMTLSGGSSSKIGIRLATAEEIAKDTLVKQLFASSEERGRDRAVAFRATEPLPRATSFTLTIDAGTPSAEGPRVTTSPQSFAFYTYEPLSVIEHHCWWQEPCSPQAQWTVRFNNPLDAKRFDPKAVRISPEVPGFSAMVSGDSLTIGGAFAGRTVYTLTVPASMTDTFGQSLGQDKALVFRVGPADKTLEVSGDNVLVLDPAGGAKLPIWSTNHSSLKVTIHKVEPKDYGAWLEWMRALWYEDSRPKRLPGSPVHQGTLSPPKDPDRLVETPLDFTPYLTDGSGQFVVMIEPSVQPKNRWERQYIYKWVQVTKLGLAAFVDGERAVGWATDLSTGQSAEGVSLSLLRGSASAKTGADGLGELALPSDGADTPNAIVARRGTDVALLPEGTAPWQSTGWIHWQKLDQLSWYIADDRGLYRPGETAKVKGWLRIWQPGPKGDVVGFGDKPSAKVHFKLADVYGNEILQGDAPVSGLGGFHFDVALPKDMNLGSAQLTIEARGAGTVDNLFAYHSLRVEEFRRPEFEVSASAERDTYTLGERATVDLSAAYYAGGGLQGAEVTWSVYAQETSFSPPGFADWTFGRYVPWWYSWDEPYGEQFIGNFASKTDSAGVHHLGMHFRSLSPARPMTVRAEGTVMDTNRQAWTSSKSVLLHPSSVYVGLKTDLAFVEPKEPVSVQLALVDTEGEPAAGEITVRFARLEWGVDAEGRWGQHEEDVEGCDAAVSEGRASCKFTPVRGGSYRVTASAKDAQGRPTESTLDVWVSGAERVPSRDVALEELTLVPDKKDVAPGETLKLLVSAPFFPAEGALTLRRSGILEARRFRMDGPSTTLSVPIEAAHIPDLTLQVDLVGAAPRLMDDGKPAEGKPGRVAHASGSITVSIPPAERTLSVALAQKDQKTEPGAQTEIGVTVSDASGKPVSGAELAVVVADESVLALTGYRLPDPIAVFYTSRGPGVTDYRLRSFVTLADPRRVSPPQGSTGAGVEGGVMGGLVGGDLAQPTTTVELSAAAPIEAKEESKPKADKSVAADDDRAYRARAKDSTGEEGESAQSAGPIAMRTDFSALALFAPDVRTDAQGKAVVPLKLPDNLTRYRIMVVAVDGEHAFGATDGAITARLPLMVRPSAPRFLNFGDQIELPVVLQNQTDAEMTVDLAVRASNLRFTDTIAETLPDLPDVAVSSAGRRVKVPANDRVEVRFPAATLMAGTARMQFVGVSGAYQDAASAQLPVYTPATTEAFATYGSIDGPGVVQPVRAPSDVWTQFGGLTVTTSSTQLQALTDAVIYLQSYPFECNEQLASRLMSIAALRDVLSAFEADGLPPKEELDAQVASDIERLSRRQHWNGGFAFWRKGDEPWPYLSIHVAHALARARSKGYAVPDDTWSRSNQHLRDIRSHIPHDYSQESKWLLEAYALDVRRRMSDADVRRARALYQEAKGSLGIDGLAFLLPTLHEGGATAEAAAILKAISNSTTESAGTAHFVTSYSDGAHVLLHSDRRADGIVLSALMESKPDDELVEKVVRGLLAHKTKGRWGNTQENAFVLLALDRYFQTYERSTPDFVARLWLGEDYAGEHAFKGRTTEREHVSIPMGMLTEHKGDVPLTLQRDGKQGRLYYRIGMDYAPKSLRLEPADYGFAVERTYEAIDDPSDVARGSDGTWTIKAGARVRVKLTMANEMRRSHVALVDPLPGGLEAQNPALATTGTLPQSGAEKQPWWWWWSRTWYEHENLRDERVEAFTSLLWDGVHEYEYVARATTPGRYVVPPAKAEEMYMPETFGRSGTDIVVVR